MNDPLAHLIVERGFDHFQDGLRARFRRFRLNYVLTYCEPTNTPAMRLDFESALHCGRVTVWTSGACEMEVLEVVTGKSVFQEHHDFASESEFLATYPKLVVFMRDALRT
jgi:hypothetical protein